MPNLTYVPESTITQQNYLYTERKFPKVRFETQVERGDKYDN
jgi:hypothetical protein